VIGELPLLPSLVAVMMTTPSFFPFTRPVGVTIAILLALVVHVTRRPVSTFPSASLVVAVNCKVCPSCIVAVGGETTTKATAAGSSGAVPAAVTVRVDVPVFVSLVAVIVAVPAETPVTTPAGETVAT